MGFSLLKSKDINYDLIVDVMKLEPKRICFSSTHKSSLCKDAKGKYYGKFAVPFEDSIKPIFELETELILFSKFGAWFLSFKVGDEEKYNKADSFVKKYKSTVFLRDCLDLSVALSENINEANELTYIGNLEKEAKYNNNKDASIELSNICIDFIANNPFYVNADYVCAVPPSKIGEINLPRILTSLIGDSLKKDISNHINWSKSKAQLKELPTIDDKWNTLVSTDLKIDINIENKTIILIDDLYQSGTTMQYVAMKLKEAGASYVYGLSIVKARNNRAYV